jgi:hypothetical protein
LLIVLTSIFAGQLAAQEWGHDRDSFDSGFALDTSSLNFGFFLSAQAAGEAVANRALHNSIRVYATTTTGGPTAATLPQNGTSPRRQRSGRMRRNNGPTGTHELTPAANGTLVYDSSLNVYWLADANLAGDPQVRDRMGVTGINANGTMDYPTAQKWVSALNEYNHGQGYLDHNNWQLPVTPSKDSTCSSHNHGSFGASCTGRALGSLYNVGLARTFPDSVVPDFTNTVGPLRNLQPALYWTTDQNSGGQVTFSFNTGLHGSNTPMYNYLHVLATTRGAIGTPPAGSGVVPYTSGPAAGKAVYDVQAGRTWSLDANLARANTFLITGTTTITSKVNSSVLTVPLIDKDGAMLFDTANGSSGWLAAMNHSDYAGTNKWTLPSLQDLEDLMKDLQLQPGDSRLVAQGRVGPFRHLQPFFYWACERDQNGNSQSPCNPSLHPPPDPKGDPMAWSFNFDNGFEGTSQTTKQFYVMVYYPAAAPGPTPPPSRCGTPLQCCIKAGGYWNGNRCE